MESLLIKPLNLTTDIGLLRFSIECCLNVSQMLHLTSVMLRQRVLKHLGLTHSCVQIPDFW
jgi:hypothetical protein